MGDKINTSGNDIYFTIPMFGDVAYLASNRPGSLGMEDIYAVPLEQFETAPVSGGLVVIKGTVADRSSCAAPAAGSAIEIKTCKPVAGAQVRVHKTGSPTAAMEKATDSAGLFQMTLPAAEGYTISVSAEGFKPFSGKLAVEKDQSYQVIEKNLLLDPQ